MKQRVTLKDIAQAAGVSTNAVSFVLHNTSTNVRVAPATAERIKRLAVELGYRSNREARVLIAQRFNKRVPFHLIALFINAGTENGNFIIDPFFSKYILGVLSESNQAGTDVVLCHANRGQVPSLIAEERVDGIISLVSHPLFEQISQHDLPMVAVGHTIAESLQGAMYNITADSIDGFRQTTRHLIELGHRKIAYLGQVLDFPEATLRFQGYSQELEGHGLPWIPAWHETSITIQSPVAGAEAMARMLARDPSYRASGRPAFTAVVCYNDTLAIGALRHLQSCGLRVPADVSLVGYDDISMELGSSLPLTSVAYDRYTMGVRAVDIISQTCMLTGEEKPAPCQEVMPVTLAVRESTAPPK